MEYQAEFYVLLTVHPGMIIVNNQLDTQFFLVCLFLFSTCFGQPCAHYQENYCMQVNLHTRQSSTQSDINQVLHSYNNSPDDGHMAARNM